MSAGQNPVSLGSLVSCPQWTVRFLPQRHINQPERFWLQIATFHWTLDFAHFSIPTAVYQQLFHAYPKFLCLLIFSDSPQDDLIRSCVCITGFIINFEERSFLNISLWFDHVSLKVTVVHFLLGCATFFLLQIPMPFTLLSRICNSLYPAHSYVLLFAPDSNY